MSPTLPEGGGGVEGVEGFKGEKGGISLLA